MGVKISELATDAKLPDNDSLLEVSERAVPTGYASKQFTRIGLTKRVYFNLDGTSTSFEVSGEQLQQLCDFDIAQAEIQSPYSGIPERFVGTIEVAATAYEKATTRRCGSTLSQIIIGDNGGATVKTYAGGGLSMVEIPIRTLPDFSTYSGSSGGAVYPIVADCSSSSTLSLTFNLVWDDYAPTPAPIRISGYMDINVVPQFGLSG